MTTTPLPKVSDAIRTMARGLLENFRHGIPASEMTNLASALFVHADNVGKVEHMLDKHLKAERVPSLSRRRRPWRLEAAEVPPGGAEIVQLATRARPRLATDGGVA